MAGRKYAFVSYSSQNRKFVKKLIDLFAYNQIDYWVAPDMIAAGSNYAKAIPGAIRECEVFIIVLSKESQDSIWVEKEIDMAVCNKKTIIPIQIDDEPMSDMYKFYLNNVQAIKSDNGSECFNELLLRLHDIFSGKIIVKEASVLGESNKDEATNKKNERDEKLSERIKRKYTDKKSKTNALRYNRIPIRCEYCDGDVEQNEYGQYICISCKKENYDDYHKVRAYIDKYGATPAAVISRNTKVPMSTINHFFEEEFLEIPSYQQTRMSCSMCGSPIRTGTICSDCKRIQSFDKKPVTSGKWHSSRWDK